MSYPEDSGVGYSFSNGESRTRPFLSSRRDIPLVAGMALAGMRTLLAIFLFALANQPDAEHLGWLDPPTILLVAAVFSFHMPSAGLGIRTFAVLGIPVWFGIGVAIGSLATLIARRMGR